MRLCIHVHVCMYACMYVRCVCLSLSLCLSVCLSVCLSFCLSVFLSVSLLRSYCTTILAIDVPFSSAILLFRERTSWSRCYLFSSGILSRHKVGMGRFLSPSLETFSRTSQIVESFLLWLAVMYTDSMDILSILHKSVNHHTHFSSSIFQKIKVFYSCFLYVKRWQ